MVGIALDRSVELNQTAFGESSIHVVAFVDADGDLIALGHDVGVEPHMLHEHRTYDHWIVVGNETRDLVLLELLRERFESYEAPTAEFMQWLQSHGIPHEVGSAVGEHRGPARIGATGHRRNGRGPKPTRVGR